MNKSIILLVIVFFLEACSGNDKDEVRSITDTTQTIAKKGQQENNQIDSFPIFTNMEQVEFCLPVPLYEYSADSTTDYERAKYVFVSNKNKKHEIILQGLFRSEPNVTIEEYFKSSFTDEDEANGKIIERKELIVDRNCFYAKGYWSNLIYQSRFIEIVWLRKDEVVKYSVTYDVTDTLLWSRRLNQIMGYDSFCK